MFRDIKMFFVKLYCLSGKDSSRSHVVYMRRLNILILSFKIFEHIRYSSILTLDFIWSSFYKYFEKLSTRKMMQNAVFTFLTVHKISFKF